MDAGIFHETATAATQPWSIWNLHAEVALGFGQIIVGLVQAMLIIGGLWMMNKSAKRRDNQLAEQHRESQIQFQEIVRQNQRIAEQGQTSIDALREVTGQSQASLDALRGLTQQSQASLDALRGLTQQSQTSHDALRAVLERLNPPLAEPAGD